ncbi:MAG: hypothetical protein RR646_04045 [Erysipelotrichaceae bacterium]
MININCPIKQDFIIELLENSNEEDITFKLIEKHGINMKFSVSTEDLDAAIALAKKIIKRTEVGSVLYFQMTK